jgi:hypothetical protein
VYKGERWRLGPKVIFESSDPTVEEWISLLRVLYADGGMFAHGVTYREFLTQRLSSKSWNQTEAHAAEIALCDSGGMPQTQEEMKILLGDAVVPVTEAQPQLELVF